MIDVNISIPDSLRTALDPKQYEQALDATVRGAAESLRKFIAVKPPPSHKPVIWRSNEERDAYRSMRFSAGLPLKYSRENDTQSQRLLASWTSRRTGQALYVVGTRVSYAAKVQGKWQQHPQHKATGWKTDEQAIDELNKSGDIERIGKQAVTKITGVT